MKLDDVLKIPAGAQLDALVEGRVFGRVPCDGWETVPMGPFGLRWRRTCTDHAEGECYWRERQPSYSTNAEAAMLVFFHGLERHGTACIDADMEDYGRELGRIVTVEIGSRRVSGPLEWAVCVAALLAEDVDVDEVQR